MGSGGRRRHGHGARPSRCAPGRRFSYRDPSGNIGDLLALDAFHTDISDENLRLRFFSPSRAVARQYVEHLGTSANTITLLVERDGTLVTVGTAEPVGLDVAEVAFLVDDGQHGLALVSLLLEHLAAAGRARGVRRFGAEILAQNSGMLRVFTDVGFTVSTQADQGDIRLGMDMVNSTAALAAADERECQSEARSLRPLLYPRTVAVTGSAGTAVASARQASARSLLLVRRVHGFPIWHLGGTVRDLLRYSTSPVEVGPSGSRTTVRQSIRSPRGTRDFRPDRRQVIGDSM